MKILSVLALVIITSVSAYGQAMPWRKQIALDANIALPGGDVGKSLGTGFGATGTFYHQLLSRNVFLSVGVGYLSFPFEGSSNAMMTTIPLLVGARYNFAITGFQPYIGLELGAYFTSASASGSGVTLNTETETNLGLQPKVGFRYPLGPGLDFDASVKYHVIMVENSSFSVIAPGIGIAYTID